MPEQFRRGMQDATGNYPQTMSVRHLLRTLFPFGWRATLSAVSSNIRNYGWTATAMKIVRRLRFSSSFYRGFLSGLKRKGIESVDAGGEVFATPRVFIVGALDLPQCKKYRVLQKLEYFESIGWHSGYADYLDQARVISNLQISTALIFYRVPDIPLLDDYIAEASRLGIRTYYDIDDPIFDQAVYSENSNLNHLQADERSHLLQETERYRQAMDKAGSLILSTTYLRELAAGQFDKPTYLWRNLCDRATQSMIGDSQKGQFHADADDIVIVYASGSRAHDEDFMDAAGALAEVLALHENVRLRVLGYAAIPAVLQPLTHRIESQPFSGYLQYLQSLGESDIHIVPLVRSRFNECKSAIRYFEASLCGLPTIATDVGQFSEVIVDGRDGYLARSESDWKLKLLELVGDREARRNMAMQARSNVLSHHSTNSPGAVDQTMLDQFRLSDE